MQLFCCHCPGQALMQLFKLICLVFRAGDQNSWILQGTQLPKKMIAWAFKKLELHLIVNSRLLSRLWTAVWNQFRHRATHASRMVSARFVGLLKSSEGLSNRKLNYHCGLASSQAGMQKACVPAEKLKSREQQQQNHQGSFLGICSLPILYSFGVDEHQHVPAWLAILLLEDGWCTQVVAAQRGWEVEAQSCL